MRQCVTAIAAIVLSFAPQAGQCASLCVTELGAVANDDRDDAEAINRAIGQAKSGETVLVPEGTFVLADHIVLKSDVALMGEGRAATRLVHSGEKAHCLVRMKGVKNVEVSKLTLDGGNSPNAQQGIVASKCANVRFHHLTIQDFVDTGAFGPHGILCSGTSHSVISDNTILNMAPDDPWGAGMRVSEPCSGNRILRNIIHNTGRGGIFTNNGATDVVISENIVTGSHGIAFAIEVHSRSVRTVVEDNIVDHGLSIVSANCAVRRNIVINPGGTWGSYGIEGGGGPDGVVTDNVIDYGQKQGISLSGPQRYMFWARNRFVNCSQWGIQIQGPSETNRIRCLYFYGNTFSKMKRGHPSARYPGHDGHAIRFNNHAAHIVFDSNRITDNAGLGIQVTSGKDVNHLCFVNNVITGNRMGSINHYPGDAVLWENNLVSGNRTDTELETTGFTGEPPVASFSAPIAALVGEPVQFRNTSTAKVDEIDHVLWDFGAGIPSSEMNPSCTYQRPGVYRVSLVVWNKQGRGALATDHMIRVSAK